MPNCFQLTRKSDLQSGPVVLQLIDDELRVHFEQPADPENWLAGWYDSIGMRLAMGKTFDEIRTEFQGYVDQDQDYRDGRYKELYIALLTIVNYLDENFTKDSWAEIGRR